MHRYAVLKIKSNAMQMRNVIATALAAFGSILNTIFSTGGHIMPIAAVISAPHTSDISMQIYPNKL